MTLFYVLMLVFARKRRMRQCCVLLNLLVIGVATELVPSAGVFWLVIFIMVCCDQLHWVLGVLDRWVVGNFWRIMGLNWLVTSSAKTLQSSCFDGSQNAKVEEPRCKTTTAIAGINSGDKEYDYDKVIRKKEAMAG